MKSFLKKLLPFFLTLLFISCANGLNNSASITINLPGAASRSVTEEELKSFTYSIDLVCPGNRTVNYSMNYGESKTISDLVPGTYKVIVSAYDGASKVYEGTDTVTVSAGKDAIAKIIMKAFVPFADALKARAVFKYDELTFTPKTAGSDPNMYCPLDLRSFFSGENEMKEGETIIVKVKGKAGCQIGSIAAQVACITDTGEGTDVEDFDNKYNTTLPDMKYEANTELNLIFPLNQIKCSPYEQYGAMPNTVEFFGQFDSTEGKITDAVVEVIIYKKEAKIVGFPRGQYQGQYRDDGTFFGLIPDELRQNNKIQIIVSGTSNMDVLFSEVQVINKQYGYEAITGTQINNIISFNNGKKQTINKTVSVTQQDYYRQKPELYLQMVHECDSADSPILMFRDFSVELTVTPSN